MKTSNDSKKANNANEENKSNLQAKNKANNYSLASCMLAVEEDSKRLTSRLEVLILFEHDSKERLRASGWDNELKAAQGNEVQLKQIACAQRERIISFCSHKHLVLSSARALSSSRLKLNQAISVTSAFLEGALGCPAVILDTVTNQLALSIACFETTDPKRLWDWYERTKENNLSDNEIDTALWSALNDVLTAPWAGPYFDELIETKLVYPINQIVEQEMLGSYGSSFYNRREYVAALYELDDHLEESCGKAAAQCPRLRVMEALAEELRALQSAVLREYIWELPDHSIIVEIEQLRFRLADALRSAVGEIFAGEEITPLSEISFSSFTSKIGMAKEFCRSAILNCLGVDVLLRKAGKDLVRFQTMKMKKAASAAI